MGYTLRAGGLVAMTEAFQASNPGSNPGRRIPFPYFPLFSCAGVAQPGQRRRA